MFYDDEWAGKHARWQDADRLSVAESMGRKLTAFNIQAEGYLSNRRGRWSCGGGSGRRPAWPLRREMARDGRVFYGLTCKGAFRDTPKGQPDPRIETARVVDGASGSP